MDEDKGNTDDSITPADPPPAVPSTASEEVHLGPPAEAPKRRTRRLVVLAAVIAGLLLIAGGAAAAVLFALRGSSDVLVDKAPGDSIVYATAYLDPAASQKLNLLNVLGKFPAMDRDHVGEQFSNLMDQALSPMDLSFEQDVKPWVGSQVGVVVRMRGDLPGTALLIATSDSGAAQDALTKLRSAPMYDNDTWTDTDYHGATISVAGFNMPDTTDMPMDMPMDPSMVYSIVEDTVILSSDVDTAKAVIDAATGGSDSLADDPDYAGTMDLLPEARLANIFINAPQLTSLMANRVGVTQLSAAGLDDSLKRLESIQGLGMSMAAESNGLSMKVAALTDAAPSAGAAPHQNAVVAWTPPDAYGLYTGTGLGDTLTNLLGAAEQASPGIKEGLDAFGMTTAIQALSGDFGVAVTPGTTAVPAGGMLMATDDEASMRDFLDKLSAQITPLAASAADSAASMGSLGDSGITRISNTVPAARLTWKTESYNGATISYLPLPAADVSEIGLSPAYTVTDGMAIIATSPEEVKAMIDAKGGQNLTTSANYSAAIGQAESENTGMVYVDIQAILEAAKVADPMSASDMEQLQPLKAVIVTSGGTSGKPVATLFVLIT
jgi:hypothetical protein